VVKGRDHVAAGSAARRGAMTAGPVVLIALPPRELGGPHRVCCRLSSLHSGGRAFLVLVVQFLNRHGDLRGARASPSLSPRSGWPGACAVSIGYRSPLRVKVDRRR